MQVDQHLEITPTFGGLEEGDTFEFNNAVFMKVTEMFTRNIGTVNAVRLSNGSLTFLGDHNYVIKREYKAVPA